MKKKEWNEGLNYLDPDLVEKHIEQKERLRQKNKKPKGVWLRFGAIAACFALVISAVIVVPMFRDSGDNPIINSPNSPSTVFWTLLLIMRATPFLFQDYSRYNGHLN